MQATGERTLQGSKRKGLVNAGTLQRRAADLADLAAEASAISARMEALDIADVVIDGVTKCRRGIDHIRDFLLATDRQIRQIEWEQRNESATTPFDPPRFQRGRKTPELARLTQQINFIRTL